MLCRAKQRLWATVLQWTTTFRSTCFSMGRPSDKAPCSLQHSQSPPTSKPLSFALSHFLCNCLAVSRAPSSMRKGGGGRWGVVNLSQGGGYWHREFSVSFRRHASSAVLIWTATTMALNPTLRWCSSPLLPFNFYF